MSPLSEAVRLGRVDEVEEYLDKFGTVALKAKFHFDLTVEQVCPDEAEPSYHYSTPIRL